MGGFGSYSAVGSGGDVGGAAVAYKAELHGNEHTDGGAGREYAGKTVPQPMTQMHHPSSNQHG